jgi:hypothetical protein
MSFAKVYDIARSTPTFHFNRSESLFAAPTAGGPASLIARPGFHQQPKESHETSHSLSKSVALSPELQAESHPPHQTHREAALQLSPGPIRSETANQSGGRLNAINAVAGLVVSPPRQFPESENPMNETQSESESAGVEDEIDNAELHRLALQLDVYRHERLAYTDPPARQPKPKPPVSCRMKKFLAAVSCWVIARC